MPLGPVEEERHERESLYLHLNDIRFLSRSDDLLNPNYGLSVIWADRPILIPSVYIYIVQGSPSGCGYLESWRCRMLKGRTQAFLCV